MTLKSRKCSILFLVKNLALMGKATIQPSKPHFFIFYIPDSVDKFSIPKDFYKDYLRGENWEGQAVLRTNRSSESWIVRLKGLRFRNGWENFVRSNNLSVGDLLVFKHEGDFVFDVLVFDNTLCERKHTTIDVPGKPEDHQAIVKAKTAKKKRNRCGHARHFTITLAPSHFKWRSVGIPAQFARENGLLNNRGMITLKDPKGRSWQVMLRYKKQSGNGSAYATIGAGWVQFSNANKLKVGDVCTFKLLSGGSKKVQMEVSVSKS